MIEVSNVTKKYGKITAIEKVSFTVEQNTIMGFLGPNGAGKTTIMNMITGYVPYNTGSIKNCGIEVADHPNEIKSMIGYLPELPPLYPDMLVYDYLKFVCEIKNIRRDKIKSEMDRAMELVDIADVKKRTIRNLSKGYKQRVGLAQALLGSPKILILDEPTVGLDPQQISDLRKVMKQLGKESTILLSSHILQEVSFVCDKVVVINKGQVLACDSPENLTSGLPDGVRYNIKIMGPYDDIISAIENIEGVYKTQLIQNENDETIISVHMKNNSAVQKEIFFHLAEKGFAIIESFKVNSSLEDSFLNLLKK